MKWDRWVGNSAGEPVFYIKHLFHIFGRRIDIHKMVQADAEACFHTHPANAFRIILKGGYVEETPAVSLFTGNFVPGIFHRWTPGKMGFIKPSFTHRIHRLISGPSYSLWLRGKRTKEIQLIGDGWAKLGVNPMVGSDGIVNDEGIST